MKTYRIPTILGTPKVRRGAPSFSSSTLSRLGVAVALWGAECRHLSDIDLVCPARPAQLPGGNDSPHGDTRRLAPLGVFDAVSPAVTSARTYSITLSAAVLLPGFCRPTF